MHRVARETIVRKFPRVGLDLVNRAGVIVVTADGWDQIIASALRLTPGVYGIVDSGNLHLGSIEIAADRSWVLRGFRKP